MYMITSQLETKHSEKRQYEQNYVQQLYTLHIQNMSFLGSSVSVFYSYFWRHIIGQSQQK